MNSTFDAFIRSWPFEPWILLCLLLTALVYARGWRVLRSRDPGRWGLMQLSAFGAGLTTVFLALASPIEPFASLLLQAHMLQHLLLIMIAPPLLWLGAPLFPMLRGLPRTIRAAWAARLFRMAFLRRILETVTHPVPAWLILTATTWFWHLPRIYDLALASSSWHYLQHACFLGSGLLFWYPVIRPYPSRPSWSTWLLVPYLILADVQNTLLSALLTFSDHPLYSYYVERPRIGNLSPVEDQQAAGALMWVPGSIVYLAPLFGVGIGLLFGNQGTSRRRLRTLQGGTPSNALRPVPQAALPVIGQRRPPVESPAFDLLRVPMLGRFLRWRHARICFQVPLLLLAAVVVFDGMRGPAIGAMNMAGVLPWIHWRGLVVLGLLAAGNVFCMACPFMLPRTIARRWLPRGRNWPRWLRNKWPAIGLLIGFLWTYEIFALWDSPWWTAWIILGYFAAALVVDGLFRGASFCKYVCPIGQFNFVQSLISPLEIKLREPELCSKCQTKDCIRGNEMIPGCELHLYQPRKSSNMDCTFCLDCIHACPHENIGILSTFPGAELWHDPRRSGIGRFGRRLDLAALVIVLVFGAFTNAGWMTGPVIDWQDRIASAVGPKLAFPSTAALYLAALIVWPLAMVGAATVLCQQWGRPTSGWREIVTSYSYALVPLGFAMWLSHYGFHLATGCLSMVPTTQRFLMDRGWPILGAPDWSCGCCGPVPGWLLRAQILCLDLGVLLSLRTGYRIAVSRHPNASRALKALAPWAILILGLFALGIWILFQPMQMRGTIQ